MRVQSAVCVKNLGVRFLLSTASLASWGLIWTRRPALLSRRTLLLRFVRLDQSKALINV